MMDITLQVQRGINYAIWNNKNWAGYKTNG